MVLDVLDDLGYLYECRRNLLDVVDPLRVEPPGSASDNAAKLALEMLPD
jgi:hypothetical protein